MPGAPVACCGSLRDYARHKVLHSNALRNMAMTEQNRSWARIAGRVGCALAHGDRSSRTRPWAGLVRRDLCLTRGTIEQDSPMGESCSMFDA